MTATPIAMLLSWLAGSAPLMINTNIATARRRYFSRAPISQIGEITALVQGGADSDLLLFPEMPDVRSVLADDIRENTAALHGQGWSY